MQKFLKWIIKKEDDNKTLLVFLKNKLLASNSQIKKALDKGLCLIDNKIQRFGSTVLKKGMLVKFNQNWQSLFKQQSFSSLKILYEDQCFLAIDKPVDFICIDDTIHRFFPRQYTLIHRLDKQTTGVLLIAKSKDFKDFMIELFQKKEVKKTYLALLDKVIHLDDITIDNYLTQHKKIQGQTIYKSSKNGKRAITHLKVLKRYKDRTLVELIAVTGRTHQLRVHMKELNHPILGDFLYSKEFFCKKYFPRIMLHCYEVEFIHPKSLKQIKIQSPSQLF